MILVIFSYPQKGYKSITKLVLSFMLFEAVILILRSLLCPEELHFSRLPHSRMRVLQYVLVISRSSLDMRDESLKQRFACADHISCGNTDNKVIRITVHFLGPTSLARWPTIHLVSEGWKAKVPRIKYIYSFIE